jgi:nicotinamide-nucleotide amidase
MPQTYRLAEQVIADLTAQNRTLTTVESCTGGLVFATMTDIAGSSAVMERGFITYSNQAKQDLVGVAEETLIAHGAVSEEVAAEMAMGGYRLSADGALAVALTGIAGPGGGSLAKPVGLVYIAVADKARCSVFKNHFSGSRAAIRSAAVASALTEISNFMT